MKTETLNKTIKFIKKSMLPNTFSSFVISNGKYRYQYLVPCECNNPKCPPETVFSVNTFTGKEIDYIKEKLND